MCYFFYETNRKYHLLEENNLVPKAYTVPCISLQICRYYYGRVVVGTDLLQLSFRPDMRRRTPPSFLMDSAHQRLERRRLQREVRCRINKFFSFLVFFIYHFILWDSFTYMHLPIECMCKWEHKDGCVGSKCEYQMGLSWYHYSCEDCRCVAEPSS